MLISWLTEKVTARRSTRRVGSARDGAGQEFGVIVENSRGSAVVTMAPVLENRETLRKKKIVFGLSALDDPKWKMVDQKIKNLLRRREKTGGGKRETGAKWLLRGPQGACLAAIIPGDSAAEAVLTSGVISFM